MAIHIRKTISILFAVLFAVNMGTAFAGDSGAVDVNDEIKNTTIFSLHDGPLSRAQYFMVRDITE